MNIINLYIRLSYIQLCQLINAIMAFFYNFPIIKKMHGHTYGFYGFKSVVNRIAFVGAFLFHFFKDALSYVVVLGGISVGIKSLLGLLPIVNDLSVLEILILLNLAMFIFVSNTMNNIVSIKQLKTYYHLPLMDLVYIKEFVTPFNTFINEWIILSIVAHFTSMITYVQAFLIALLFLTTNIVCSALNLKLHHVKKSLGGFILFIIFLVIFFGLVYSYRLWGQNQTFVLLVLNGMSLVALPMAIGIIQTYPHYDGILEDSTLSKYEAATKHRYTNQVALKDSDVRIKKSHKKGYALLNDLFFKRNFRLLVKPSLIKTGVYLAITAFYVLAMRLNWFHFAEKDHLYAILSTTPIVMYIGCNDSSIIISMYYNCDNSLLEYGFYKQSKAILEMLYLRLWSMLKIFLMPTSAFLFFVAIASKLSKIPLDNMLKLMASSLFLMVFFAFYLLLIYYLLVPFTQDEKIKNPIYYIVNFAVYMIFIFGNKYITSVDMLFYLSLIVMIVVVVFGGVAIYYLAPKTFRRK